MLRFVTTNEGKVREARDYLGDVVAEVEAWAYDYPELQHDELEVIATHGARDAFEAGDGALLPLGGLVTGHKGFGLSVMSELLSGNASDGSVSGMDDVLWGNHALFYVTDIERCTTRDALEARVTALVEYVRETDYSEHVPMPRATKSDRALVPGEAEHRTREENREHGVPIPDGDAAMLRELAAELGLSDAVPDPLR